MYHRKISCIQKPAHIKFSCIFLLVHSRIPLASFHSNSDAPSHRQFHRQNIFSVQADQLSSAATYGLLVGWSVLTDRTNAHAQMMMMMMAGKKRALSTNPIIHPYRLTSDDRTTLLHGLCEWRSNNGERRRRRLRVRWLCVIFG